MNNKVRAVNTVKLKIPKALREQVWLQFIGKKYSSECYVKWCKNNHLIEWIGGDTVIVQVGDQIDSCRYDGLNTCNDPTNYEFDEPHDINILYFMTALHKKAAAKGGAVYSLMGNHELMNVRGDLSYVSHSNIQYFNNLIPNVNMYLPLEILLLIF